MQYYATWQYKQYAGLKAIAESKLQKMFVLPKFTILLRDTPLNRRLQLDKEWAVTYTKNKPMFCVFACDVSTPKYSEQWSWYQHHNGGSAISLGPLFMQEPQMVAQQTAFWVPLEQFFCFPNDQLKFKNHFTISFVIQEDTIPFKTKRIWIKKYLRALQGYQKKEK
jgi:hypothetical protein